MASLWLYFIIVIIRGQVAIRSINTIDMEGRTLIARIAKHCKYNQHSFKNCGSYRDLTNNCTQSSDHVYWNGDIDLAIVEVEWTG